MKSFFYLIILLCAGSLWSGPWNYESVIIGERIFGMAGTGIALGNEISSAYYNPAGLIASPGSSITMSGNLYSRIDISMEQKKSFFSSVRDQISQGGFVTIPAAWGGALKRKRWAVGGFVFIPDSFAYVGNYNIKTASGLDARGLVNTKDETSWYGLSWSFRLSDSFLFGSSLAYVSRGYNESNSVSSRNTSSNDVNQVTVARDFSSNSIVITTGFQYKIFEYWALGLVLRFPSMHLGGRGNYYRSDVRTIAGTLQDTSGSARDLVKMSANTKQPAKIGFGIGYEKPKHFAIEFNINVYPAQRYFEFDTQDVAVNREFYGSTTVNYRLGAEWYIYPRWVMRGGLFTNSSAARDPNPNINTFQSLKINFTGFSGTLSYETERATLSFGGYYQGGSGYGSLLNSDGLYYVYPRSEFYYTFLLSSTYHF